MKTDALLISFILLGLTACQSTEKSAVREAARPDPSWDQTRTELWGEPFELITIRSSIDQEQQMAYGFRTKDSSPPAPLVVSLHTWSGDFEQKDPLAALLAQNGFHYIHPDFRGPNWTPQSCASPLALQDIDDAINYCIEHWNVDTNRIYVIGVSGGGHATCASYFNSRHDIAAFFAWVPITDLELWYRQCKQRGSKYAGHLEKIFSDKFDPVAAKTRSPLFMDSRNRKGRLHLYAGINDGYNGSVPILHSIRLYNRLCEDANSTGNSVSPKETADLLSKATTATGIKIDGRDVLFHRASPLAELTLFEGGHEMLVNHALEQLIESAFSQTR